MRGVSLTKKQPPGTPAPPLRALFMTQGAIGTAVLGHAMAALTVERGLAGRSDIAPQFEAVGPRGRVSRIAARPIPVLGRLGIDLAGLRYHLTESYRGLAATRRALRQRPADVVSLTSHTLGLLSGPIRRRAAVVLNVDATIWDWGAMGHIRRLSPLRRFMLSGDLTLERRAFHRAALVIAWSTWARDGVLRRAPQARVEVIHPGLDLDVFTPPARRVEGPVRLLFVGGRLEAKGGLDLIEAARPLLESGRATLDVVTADEVPQAPGVRAHRLGAGSPELVALYQQADIFALPSWGDAVPWVVLEALACRTAVIGSRVGAIPDMLDNGRVGVLAPPRDRQALRAALVDLVDDEDRRNELAAAGLAHIQANYDLRRQSERLVEALQASVARA